MTKQFELRWSTLKGPLAWSSLFETVFASILGNGIAFTGETIDDCETIFMIIDWFKLNYINVYHGADIRKNESVFHIFII